MPLLSHHGHVKKQTDEFRHQAFVRKSDRSHGTKGPFYSGNPPIGVFHLRMGLWPREGVDAYKHK